jgi:hypothetical protein
MENLFARKSVRSVENADVRRKKEPETELHGSRSGSGLHISPPADDG